MNMNILHAKKILLPKQSKLMEQAKSIYFLVGKFL